MAPPFRYDLKIQQLPSTLPNVGGLYGKNTIITDPDFGSQIVRATDASSGTGINFDSMETVDGPSGYTMWNTDDTLMVTRSTGGSMFMTQFNPATMQVTQLGGPNPSSPYKLGGAGCFSKVTPGLFYNCPNNSTVVNALTFTLVSGVWTYQSTAVVCDFANILPGGFVVTWQSELGCALGDAKFSMAFSATGNQNSGFLACVYNPAAPGYRMVNTQTLAVTQAGTSYGPVGTATLVNAPYSSFFLHGMNQSPNPAYTLLSAVQQIGAVIWADATLTLTCSGLSGHHGLGYLAEYTGAPGRGQYDQALYSSPTVHTKVIPEQAGPPGLPGNQTPKQMYYGDQHSAFGPVSLTDASLLYVTNGPPIKNPFTSCWECELRAIDVTGAVSGQQGIVYRVCHTFNSGKSKEYIVTNSQLATSQTGNFVAFASDWGGAGTIGPLGSTSGAPTGTLGVNARGDVFIVRIPSGATAPTIISANSVTFTQNSFGSFTVNTTGSPIPAITETGSLPSGVTFVDNGNGTATLSGTPTASGTFPLTLTATNSAGTANQSFTLNVTPVIPPVAPAITSGNSATFRKGVLGSFNVNATGTPTPSLTEVGALPGGVTFVDNGNGTGTLSGTPTSTGKFSLTFTAANGVTPNAKQAFTLTVVAATPPGNVIGTFQYPNGSPVANGLYQFQLSGDAVNVSIAMTVPLLVSGTLDANGVLAASLTFNDQLLTAFGASTTYQLTVKDKAGRQVWNENYFLTGTAANLTLIPPSGGTE